MAEENKIVKVQNTPVVAQTASQSPTAGTSQPVTQTATPAQTTATNTVNANANNANMSNADYINSVYQQHLNRAPDAGGASYWNNQLNTGAVNRDQLAQLVSGSDEAYINKVYNDILGRAPDESGAAYWSNQLQGGMTRDQMADAIRSSNEAYTKEQQDKANRQNIEAQAIMDSLPQNNSQSIQIPSYAGSVSAMRSSVNLPEFNARMEQGINDLYAMAQENALAALKNAYDINLANAEYEKGRISPQYQEAMNQAAAENARQSRNLNMQAAANGLNTGAGSQMQLAQSVANQQTQGQLSVAEQQALQDATRNILNLKTKYQNDIAEAIANNNYQLAAALLNEYQEQFNRQMQVDQLNFQMAAHADQMNAQYAQMAQNAAITQAQMDYQAQQDALSNQWKQRSYADSLRQYEDSLKQQDLENQFKQQQWDYTKTQDELENQWKQKQWDYNTGADMAEALAKLGDFSGYKALGWSDAQIAEAQRQWLLQNPWAAAAVAEEAGGGGGYGGYYGGGGQDDPGTGSLNYKDLINVYYGMNGGKDANGNFTSSKAGSGAYNIDDAIADLEYAKQAGIAGADKVLNQALNNRALEDDEAYMGELARQLEAQAAANKVVSAPANQGTQSGSFWDRVADILNQNSVSIFH